MTAPIDPNWLADALAAITRVRVGVFGDFCVDAYWDIDPDPCERSVETDLPVRRVRAQRYSLGGAGNVAASLVALGTGAVHAVGLAGRDVFGHQLLSMLRAIGANVDGMFDQQPDWQTLVYTKPLVNEIEENRIDFGGFNELADSTIHALTDGLARAASQCDVVVLNQQLPAGVSPPRMIERVNAVIAAHDRCRFIVDARDRPGLYAGAILKVNAHEAAALADQPRPLDEAIPVADVRALARSLCERNDQPVIVTCGERGIVAADGRDVHEIPGVALTGPIDPVGAGDTATAALAAALGAGLDTETAARLANLAASITVAKCRTTGTATPNELRQAGPAPDYVYEPDCADDPTLARYADATHIEIIREPPATLSIQYAVFDHDGTLSTLREGWADVLEPMMVGAILGPRSDDADDALRRRVVDAVQQYIDASTGAQTLVQMHGLVDLIGQFGFVAQQDVRDVREYKQEYNTQLLQRVNARLNQISRGERTVEDFQIPGAPAMLEALHQFGVKLSLSSGTDEPDAIAEAETLGYAAMFEGRIFGAVGDVNVDPKAVVFDRALGPSTDATDQLITVGDGPVEIREARRRGGYTVGIAADEQRGGLDIAKRRRLIRAGADLIIHDYRDLDALLRILRLTDTV